MENCITYNHKIIVSGDEIEIYTYRYKQSKKEQETVISFDDEDEEKKEKKEKVEICDSDYKRKKENIRKMKIKLRRLINANAFQYKEKDKFITLTFAGEEPTREEVVEKFRQFKYRLKRRYPDVEYIAVIERGTQGTKRLHLHCIFFNLPYVKQKEFTQIWKYGRVDIQAIDSFYDLANYIVKYVEKTLEDGSYIPKGKRFYFPSQGLKKPSEYCMMNEAAEEFITQICEDKEVVCEFDYTNEFTGDCHYTKYKKLRNTIPRFENEEDLIFYLSSI